MEEEERLRRRRTTLLEGTGEQSNKEPCSEGRRMHAFPSINKVATNIVAAVKGSQIL